MVKNYVMKILWKGVKKVTHTQKKTAMEGYYFFFLGGGGLTSDPDMPGLRLASVCAIILRLSESN